MELKGGRREGKGGLEEKASRGWGPGFFFLSIEMKQALDHAWGENEK